MKFISKLLSGGAAGLIDTIGGTVDKLFTSKEERKVLDLENEESRAAACLRYEPSIVRRKEAFDGRKSISSTGCI